MSTHLSTGPLGLGAAAGPAFYDDRLVANLRRMFEAKIKV
jgi:hypothetical protein